MVLVVKNLPASAGNARDVSLIPRSGRSPEGGHATTPVFLPRESHGQRSLVGDGPQGHKELDMTKVTARTHAYRERFRDRQRERFGAIFWVVFQRIPVDRPEFSEPDSLAVMTLESGQ